MKTRCLAVSFEPGLVLGTGVHGEYSSYSRLEYPTPPKAVSLGTVVFYSSLIFLSFFLFPKYFQKGFPLKCFFYSIIFHGDVDI